MNIGINYSIPTARQTAIKHPTFRNTNPEDHTKGEGPKPKCCIINEPLATSIVALFNNLPPEGFTTKIKLHDCIENWKLFVVTYTG